jgi:membrane-bound ClpP family serine protease
VRLLVLFLALLAVATPAWAKKPKVAVAPFKGDKDNKVADAIAESLAGSVKVTDVEATKKAAD